MSSIQIGSLIYFTVIVICAWAFFSVIFLQLKRFMDMSCFVPTVAKFLTIILISLTILGYVLIFSPGVLDGFKNSESSTPTRTSGYFDTY